MIAMSIAERALAAVARQLGQPSGLAGRAVGRSSTVATGRLWSLRSPPRIADQARRRDIGFGGGVGLDTLLGRGVAVVHGVEMSETMLAEAKRRFSEPIARGRLRLHSGRMEDLPFDDSALDAIISTNTIYFVPDLAAALKELARVLRPGGRLVLGVGDPGQMSKMPFTRHGFRLRPIDELVPAIREAGFDRIEDKRVGDGQGAAHLLVGELPG